MGHGRGAHILVHAPQLGLELGQLTQIFRLLTVVDVPDATVPSQGFLQAGHVILPQIIMRTLLDEGERHGEHKGHRTADNVHQIVWQVEAQDKTHQNAQRSPQFNGER